MVGNVAVGMIMTLSGPDCLLSSLDHLTLIAACLGWYPEKLHESVLNALKSMAAPGLQLCFHVSRAILYVHVAARQGLEQFSRV